MSKEMKGERGDLIDTLREVIPILNKNWPSEVDRAPLNKLIEAFIKATS